MTAATMTLTEFLEQRIAEDEATAESALHLTRERWWVDGPARQSGKWWVYATGEKFNDRAVAEHIARHDPRRVLAECEAKREIVRRARRERGRYEQTGGNLGNPIEAVVAYETVVRALAAVYSDHPDYRDEWRP
jgi:hypothetical protein